MSDSAPQIDSRTRHELAGRLKKLVAGYCHSEWSGAEKVGADIGANALVHVFSRLMEIVIGRLNKAPDKNFLAFLEMLGVRQLAPRPSRTPVTFTLAKGAGIAVIPAGTQVASEESPDGKPVIFETGTALVASSPSLVRVVSVAPGDDRYADQSAAALGPEKGGGVELFEGRSLMPHRLYLGHKTMFAFKKASDIELWIDVEMNSSGKDGNARNVKVKWSRYDEESKGFVEIKGGDIEGEDDVINLRKTGNIRFRNVSPIGETALAGDGLSEAITARWIVAELAVPITAVGATFRIKSVKAAVAMSTNNITVGPDAAFFNTLKLDTTKNFLPFGERPKLGDAFYIGSKEIFSKVGAKITLDFGGVEGAKTSAAGVTLICEYLDGEKWINIDKVVIKPAAPEAFLNSFTCPHIRQAKFSGVESLWIRIRIAGGGYGEAPRIEERTLKGGYLVITDTSTQVKKKRVPSGSGNIVEQNLEGDDIIVSHFIGETYKPPAFAVLTLSFEYAGGNPLESVVTYNDFMYKKIERDKLGKDFLQFAPFTPGADEKPTLYLAFDEDLSGLPVSMFFSLVSRGFYLPATEKPVLEWEYWDGNIWKGIPGLVDFTGELTRMNTVVFDGPQDIRKKVHFGEEWFWIRARVVVKWPLVPMADGIYTNTVWAYNRVTKRGEILGSGTGEPFRTLSFSNAPVLPGQTIYVREDNLAETERATIVSKHGAEAVDEKKNAAGDVFETWVLWEEVPHFKFSGPGDRHYVIDRTTGQVSFGARVLPPGKDNVKSYYCVYGGGRRANNLKSKVTKLRSAIPYVDGVINHVNAVGGSDVEDMNNIAVRAPYTLKHRNKAKTFEDYEWMVREAFPVAKVKCLSATGLAKQFRPGWVTVIVVPDSEEKKPVPSEELLAAIKEHLLMRAPSHLASNLPLSQINPVAPSYLRIDVEAVVCIPNPMEVKTVKAKVAERLDRYFHPINGGADGQGWPFGRNVYLSEVYEVIEGVEGVDHVQDIAIRAAAQTFRVEAKSALTLPLDFPIYSKASFVAKAGTISLPLAHALQQDAAANTFDVVGFKEGDAVRLWRYKDDSKKEQVSLLLNITSVDGEWLECDPVIPKLNFKGESIVVETYAGADSDGEQAYFKGEDRKVVSYLVDGDISEGEELKRIKVALPTEEMKFSITHRDWPSYMVDGIANGVAGERLDIVYLDGDYLVYSGNHKIRNVGEKDVEQPPSGPVVEPGPDNDATEGTYVVNKYSGEVHWLEKSGPLCNLALIPEAHKKYLRTLNEVYFPLKDGYLDLCAWCFGSDRSKR